MVNMTALTRARREAAASVPAAPRYTKLRERLEWLCEKHGLDLATITAGLNSPWDQAEATIIVQATLAPYVTLRLAAEVTGMSVKAMQQKIYSGAWIENREYVRTPQGGIMMSMKGFQWWVESLPASRRRAHEKATDATKRVTTRSSASRKAPPPNRDFTTTLAT